MHRFFVLSRNISSGKVTIVDKKQVHYIRDVLRLKADDKIIIFDDKGSEYSCVIEEIAEHIILNVKEKSLLLQKEKQIMITVACAIPKKSKMDDIIDKLTQLGVDRIIPMESQRVIVRLDKNKKIAKHKRWQKIALSATQQSQRISLPDIEPIQKINEVLNKAEGFDLKLIPILIGERQTLKDAVVKLRPKNILVFIGPEGDFTPQELELAKGHGFVPVTLGDLVLRVDTAAIAVTSFIRLYANH